MRSYYLQPFRILPYLSRKRLTWPKTITTELYLSAEDALWDLLPRLGVKRGATLLIPNIYCKDVFGNMIEHGYKVVVYPMNIDGTYVLKDILDIVQKVMPDVFIEFQYDGIESTLLSDIERKLDFRTLVISDRVHEIVYPHVKYFPHSDRHIILNSYRKVTPFPGCIAVYTRNARRSQNKLPLKYTCNALFQWFKTLLYAKLAYIFSSSRLGKLEETSLQSHNDLIGDAERSAALPGWTKFIFEHIAIDKIIRVKNEQAKLYETMLSNILSERNKTLLANINDKGSLQGFPLIVTANRWDEFLKKARDLGLLRHYQIEYIVDTKPKERMALLPLGPSLTTKDIAEICRRVKLIY